MNNQDMIGKSKCCGVEVITNNGMMMSSHYITCSKCGKPCDTIEPKEEKEEVRCHHHFKSFEGTCCKCGINRSEVGYDIKTPTSNDWIEEIAMNIVYQLDDDAKLSVEFRQANNDKRIDFVKGLIQSSLTQQKEAIRTDTINEIRKEVESKKNTYEGLDSEDYGYNQALEDIKTFLDKMDT